MATGIVDPVRSRWPAPQNWAAASTIYGGTKLETGCTMVSITEHAQTAARSRPRAHLSILYHEDGGTRILDPDMHSRA
eukprot:CAMPEP_0113526254 /NCGR_PEP_ID=MMETSP0015_2-20120614/639_1 /TAXON_ID=2838 /ORGANISM="Odontella" /LENGTH=77 /DNA_ID=CAMNT_0000424559 /DNA_START=986 /DNA_END=1220 /DNA_ORIENTATION=+ /assembly_acc=CAM_ASM_000160